MRQRTWNDIHRLREEKAGLEEEVRQLRAAIQMYSEVARRLAAGTEVSGARESARPRPFAVAA
ncbi:MAG: hypothetical protein LAP40_11030 [Acidobacteriia bacterium]|nr:hypothetical protein [Terriglobia bacterium]